MAKDITFANGIRFEEPHEKAPSWVKGKISIKVGDFIEFLEAHKNERGWINLDVLESKKGGYYVQLNTYGRGQAKPKSVKQEEIPVIEENAYGGENQDSPAE